MSNSPVILIVEDNEADILLISKAFQQADVRTPVHVVRSGEEAIGYLKGEVPYHNRAENPLPALVLLDLSLPGIDGFEVLSWIRHQEGIGSLPVIVLTSSASISHANKAYAMGANSFFMKDIELQKTAEFSRLIRDYWLVRAMTPESYRSVPTSASHPASGQ